MAMLVAKVQIEGVRPILWHRFGPDAIPLEKQEKTGVAGNDPEEWKRTYLATKEGQLYVEPSYIFGCLREAAKYTKSGRGSIQKNVAATLQVLDDMVLIDRFMPEELTQDPTQPVYIDVRSVRNPATKGRNVRYRLAASPGWKAEFNILWDGTIVSRTQMEAVCIDAGKLVGLADGRSIGFGRFEVKKFEVSEYAKTKTA
jgi:hypothetical protein